MDFGNKHLVFLFTIGFPVLVAEECFNNPNDIYYQHLYDNTQYCAFGCCENRGYKFCCSYIGPVVGIIAGVIILVVLFIIFICCYRRHSKNKATIVLREAYEFQKHRNSQRQLAASSKGNISERSRSDSEYSYDHRHDERDYRHTDKSYNRYDSRRNKPRSRSQERPRSERDYDERYDSDRSYSDYDDRHYSRRPRDQVDSSRYRSDYQSRDHRNERRPNDRSYEERYEEERSRDRRYIDRSRGHRNPDDSHSDRHRNNDRGRRGGGASNYSAPPSYREVESNRGSVRGNPRRDHNHQRY